MYSSVPQTLRDAVCDTSVLNRRIYKGTRLILAAWGTNVDSTTLWGADAGEFNPERWLPVNDGGEQ
ncbi:hypothetical protein J3459_010824 [Metarhizium acridum]|uniref:uncharacterized protein n=1 Tax=Metarhizium acridum TaxID=92637 RepID=UPI001C6C0D82|nr:hypothetical protein J3458_019863 [Metarhizium acridum]KAG8421985.1 hypothetical protein J3459_010824 [Metarhizium acridum]